MANIIGIDLGTTNSCVSIAEGTQIKVLENSEGNRTTPSVVAYLDNKDILVGLSAKRQTITNPENTLYAVKRIIGRKYNEINLNSEFFGFKVVQHKNGDAWVKIRSGKISPQQVSAEILKKMKEIAENYLNVTVSSAVVTVPAYFNDSQRKATKDAGIIAGLDIKRIINEPTAAALAFGLDKNCANDKTIVVYDLGGGTFDISVIEMSNVDGEKQFEVLSTNGNTFLGGEDFDKRIVDFLKTEFDKKENFKLDNDPVLTQRLKEAAEKAKIELSTLKETEINLPYITSIKQIPKHMNIKLTRSKLQALVADLVDNTFVSCKTALKDANLSLLDIDDIVLVGGMTRMPYIQERVEEFFNKKPKKDVNPDEAVAIGAAIQGQILEGNRKDILLLDVIPLSLGIETLGGIMVNMINKNTTIPTRYSQVFSTADDNQPAVTIKIYQGERDLVAFNKFLGEFNLEGIESAPRGVPQIEVVFDIDSNGILNVTAKDKKTGKINEVTIKSNSGLSKEEIEEMIKDAESNKIHDKEKREFIDLKNNAESLCYEVVEFIKKNNNEIPKDKVNQLNVTVEDIEKAIKTEDKNTVSEIYQKLTGEFAAIKSIIKK